MIGVGNQNLTTEPECQAGTIALGSNHGINYLEAIPKSHCLGLVGRQLEVHLWDMMMA